MRTPLYDNARGILCLLVVVGHCLEPLLENNGLARSAYQLIYAFHIPAFAVLSGALSSSKAANVGGLAKSLLAPLVAFQILYVALDVFVLHRPWTPLNLIQPYWLLWFLLSLFFWRIALPYWTRLHAPLFWSFMLALAAGTQSFIGYPLALSRTLVFFPFFIGGHLYLRPTVDRIFKQRWARPGAVGVFLLAIWITTRPIDLRIFYGSYSYASMGFAESLGVLIRTTQLVAGGILILCFFVLCPKERGIFTVPGQRAMAPYLWHGLVVRVAAAFGLYSYLTRPFEVTGAMLAAGALFFFFSLQTFSRLANLPTSSRSRER